MKFTPRPFQADGIAHAVAFLRDGAPNARQLYAAPTGCGKSVVELAVQDEIAALGYNPWIITPRDEIITGMLDKKGFPDADCLDHRIATPVKLRNRLLNGELEWPSHCIFDETHHHNAKTWQEISLLSGHAPSVGYTASPYRGSPKSTKQFLDFWGKPKWLITWKDAIAKGYIALPIFSILPLVDDDIVEVRGGDFDVTSIESATMDRLSDLAEHAGGWYTDKWDKPTIFAMPSTELCVRLQQELGRRGMPAAIVGAKFGKTGRGPIFEQVVAGNLALIHINVVAEGVDLPLRRLVDLAPTMSPVKWVQQLGRITRPSSEPPEYICCNRNLLRHAYVLEGNVPSAAIIEAEKKYPPTTRGHSRVLGLENLGRFKAVDIKTLQGTTAFMYSLKAMMNQLTIEYVCIVPPNKDGIWASRVNVSGEAGKVYGNWRKCEAPEGLTGFSSYGQKAPSEKQMNWWLRAAARVGLDPQQDVTRKNFQALPVLLDIGEHV